MHRRAAIGRRTFKYPFYRQNLQFLRRQHEAGGHKWYFQDPPPHFRTGSSLQARLLRSALYASIFCFSGFAATSGFSTWTWLHSAFKPGEEADAMYAALIEERISVEPLTKLLEAENSEWERRQGPDGLDLCLRGSRGVSARFYTNYKKAMMIVMIHFGVGVEGLPGMTHGGVLTSFVHNAMENFAYQCFPPSSELIDPETGDLDIEKMKSYYHDGYWQPSDFEMSFEQPVPSGEVYAIIVAPATVFGPQIHERQGVAFAKIPKDDEAFSKTIVASLMQIDYMPYEEGKGRRNIRYANAAGVCSKVQWRHLRKPFEFSPDGKLS